MRRTHGVGIGSARTWRGSTVRIKAAVDIGQSIGTFVKVAIVCGAIYWVLNWQDITPHNDDIGAFAERACVDEMRQRFNAATVKVYAVKENSNGYVVRATVTFATGNTGKVYCLTNAHGGIRDISLEER